MYLVSSSDELQLLSLPSLPLATISPLYLQQTMLEDKKRSTDWEATYDAIEEAVTRESYLTWIRENEKREQPGKLAGSQVRCREQHLVSMISLVHSMAGQIRWVTVVENSAYSPPIMSSVMAWPGKLEV